MLAPSSNTIYKEFHPLYSGKLTISGKDSADPKPYQEKEVKQAIKEVEERQQENQEDERI